MNLPPYEGIFACFAILLSTYDVKFINIAQNYFKTETKANYICFC